MEIILGISITVNFFLFLLLGYINQKYDRERKKYELLYESKEWFRERYVYKFNDWVSILDNNHSEEVAKFLADLEGHRNDMMRKHDMITKDE
ncbi:MAG: hypothetical protein ACRC0G_15925 [Fusobacteriaceae bacterium]